MSSSSLPGCTENPSYFSDKCSQCRFSCLQGTHGKQGKDVPGLSVIGTVAVTMGAVSSVTGYSDAAAGLTIIGAVAIIAKLVSK